MQRTRSLPYEWWQDDDDLSTCSMSSITCSNCDFDLSTSDPSSREELRGSAATSKSIIYEELTSPNKKLSPAAGISDIGDTKVDTKIFHPSGNNFLGDDGIVLESIQGRKTVQRSKSTDHEMLKLYRQRHEMTDMKAQGKSFPEEQSPKSRTLRRRANLPKELHYSDDSNSPSSSRSRRLDRYTDRTAPTRPQRFMDKHPSFRNLNTSSHIPPKKPIRRVKDRTDEDEE